MISTSNSVVSPMFSRSDDTNEKDGSKHYLKSVAANEFIFAVVGPAGSGTSWIAEALRKILQSYKIETEILKASDVIYTWAKANEVPIEEKSKLSRAMSLQDAGDEYRGKTKDVAAVAIGLMLKIRESRSRKARTDNTISLPNLDYKGESHRESRRLFG